MTDRLIVLDGTRGLAVMGILLINIIGFSMPFGAYVNPMAWGGTSLADMTVWTVNQLFFEGRMRGLFALLFGVSALLVIERGDAADRNGTAIHLRRMTVLALIGVVHRTFVWDGDILLHYALLGLLIPFLRQLAPVQLIALAATLILVGTIGWSVTMGGALYLEHAARTPGAAPVLVKQARTMMESFPVAGSVSDLVEIARLRGGYGPILADRLADLAAAPGDLILYMGAETLAFMLIGMALWKSGFFAGGWDDRAVRRLMIRCYAGSLPALAGLTWWSFASGFDPVVLMGNFIAWSVPFRVLCAVGHLALATLMLRRFRGAWLVGRIAAVGRMALTNYLLTSIVMTSIFYGYGAGLFGHVGRAAVYGFVSAMWIAMMAWSKPWLDRFAYGPFEWLWRSLARFGLQPMLKRQPS